MNNHHFIYRNGINFDESVDTADVTEKETKKETKVDAKEGIRQALKDAEKELGPLDEKGETEDEEESEKEEKKDAKKVAKKEEEIEDEDDDEVDTQEIDNALRLFRALNDPKIGPAILQTMAKEAGITIEGSTKKEQKQLINTISEVVNEELGPEYKFLSEKLSRILNKIVPQIADEKVQEVKKAQETRDREEKGAKVTTALNEVFEQYQDVPTKVQKKFYSLLDEIPPNPSTDPKKYFQRILNLATQETETTLVIKKGSVSSNEKNERTKDRLLRNKRDAASRLASGGAETETSESRSASTQFKSNKAAIAQAVKDVESAMSTKE